MRTECNICSHSLPPLFSSLLHLAVNRWLFGLVVHLFLAIWFLWTPVLAVAYQHCHLTLLTYLYPILIFTTVNIILTTIHQSPPHLCSKCFPLLQNSHLFSHLEVENYTATVLKCLLVTAEIWQMALQSVEQQTRFCCHTHKSLLHVTILIIEILPKLLLLQIVQSIQSLDFLMICQICLRFIDSNHWGVFKLKWYVRYFYKLGTDAHTSFHCPKKPTK